MGAMRAAWVAVAVAAAAWGAPAAARTVLQVRGGGRGGGRGGVRGWAPVGGLRAGRVECGRAATAWAGPGVCPVARLRPGPAALGFGMGFVPWAASAQAMEMSTAD